MTELDEARAHLGDRQPIVLAEIGNCLVIGSEAAREPHHFDVASSLTLEPPARLNPIEVAVDVKLPSSAKPSSSTKRSMAQTGLSPAIQLPGVQETTCSDFDPCL
jgi:hypothetical protein